MRPRWRAWILIGVLGAGACTAPGPERATEPERTTPRADRDAGGTLRIAGAGVAESDLDPALGYSTTSWFLARGVFRTLVAPGPAGPTDPRPPLMGDLATDTGTPAAGSTRWTFTLRPEAAFGPGLGNRAIAGVTGEAVTCDDVKYGVERLFRPTVGAAYAFYYEPLVGVEEFRSGSADDIAGISCPDARTVVFDLDRPVPDWPLRLSLPAATPVPRRLASDLDGRDDETYAGTAVATGPYAVSSIDDEEIRLERHDHWDPAGDDIRTAGPRRVRWRTNLPATTAIERVRTGRLDLLIGIEPRGPDLAGIVEDPEASRRVIHESSGCIRALYLDTTRPPFDRVIVRRAVARAIDRYVLLRMRGGPAAGSLATSLLPPGIPGHLRSDAFDPFPSEHGTGDVQAARRVLDRAGFSDWGRRIILVGTEGAPGEDVLASVRTDLQRLGFSNIGTRSVPAGRLIPVYSATPARAHLGTGIAWCKDFDDASTILRPLLYGAEGSDATAFNFPRLDDAVLDAMMDAAAALPRGRERTKAWERANRRATRLAAWVPWSWDRITILYGERLRGANYLSFLTQIDWPNVAIDR